MSKNLLPIALFSRIKSLKRIALKVSNHMSLPEINQKVESLLHSWEEFKTLNDQRLNEIERFNHAKSATEEHLAKINDFINKQQKRIEELELSLSRPRSVQNANTSTELKQLYNYIKYGQKSDSNYNIKDSHNPFETSSSTYLKFMNFMNEKSLFRKLSSVKRVKGQITSISKEKPATVSWEPSILKSQSQEFTTKEEKVPQHTLYAQMHISPDTLENSHIDIVSWLLKEIADAFTDEEAEGFSSGDGTDKPSGILSNKTSRNEELKGSEITYDEIISLYYSLDEKYTPGAAFITNQPTAQAIRQLKTKDGGTYIWNPAFTTSGHETLLGYPLYRIPEIGNNLVYANLSRGYIIIDYGGINITRDPFTFKPNITFSFTKKISSIVQIPKAICNLNTSKAIPTITPPTTQA